MVKTGGKDYSSKLVEDVELVHYKNKIYIPAALQGRVLAWYHEYLAHPGEKRTDETIAKSSRKAGRNMVSYQQR